MAQESSINLQPARELAALGLHVFPAHSINGHRCTCGKTECSSKAKHPRTKNGLKDATTDEKQIVQWWQKWPDANIAVGTGRISGVFVLDVDNKAGIEGTASLQELEDSYGPLPATLVSKTGNGRHYFFRYPEDKKIRNSAGKLGKGLDIRGDGGYVIVPPSTHANGNKYEWLDGPGTAKIADAPEWLISQITVRNRVKVSTSRSLNDVDDVPETRRNDKLFQLGCALRGKGMDQQAIETALLDFNSLKCKPPVDESEVRDVAERAAKYPTKSGSTPLHWFQLSVLEVLGDPIIATFDDCQFGWLMRLNAYAWQRGGYLPSDTAKLAMLAHATDRTRFEAEMKDVLFQYESTYVNDKPMLRNARMTEMHAHAGGKWLQKVEAGEARKKQLREQRAREGEHSVEGDAEEAPEESL